MIIVMIIIIIIIAFFVDGELIYTIIKYLHTIYDIY